MDKRNESVVDLLKKALPKPAAVATSDGGSILVLALHVLMVKEGFIPVTEGATHNKNPYTPHPNWNTVREEWVFQYTHAKKANKFILHCSLQAASKRMYIQASEENNQNNVHILGLQLENYVPSISHLKTCEWKDILTNEEQLIKWMTTQITVPLANDAVELFDHDDDVNMSSTWLQSVRASTDSTTVWVSTGVVVAAVVVGAVLVYYRYNSTRR